MSNNDYSRTKEQLLALTVSKTVRIDCLEEFSYRTQLEEKGFSHANGQGDRVYGVIDKDGNLFSAWTANDSLANLPEGISVRRVASTITDPYGHGSFSMITRVTVHPKACPVRIFTYQETMVKRGGKSQASVRYYASQILSAL